MTKGGKIQQRRRTSPRRRRTLRKPPAATAAAESYGSQGPLRRLRDLRDLVFTPLAVSKGISGGDMASTSTLAPQFLVGSVFGAALLLSGVADPRTVVSQFTLEDFHMLSAFLTASVVSAVVIYVANWSGHATLSPRSCSDYGWLGPYGGNVVGGVMQGVGMAVSGACPGTVLVQSAMGWGRGVSVMLGCVLGGALFLSFGERLRVKTRVTGGGEVKTFQEKLGTSTGVMVVLYEAVMGSVVAAVSLLAPMGVPWWNVVRGGGLIGGAQASSVLVSRKTLGVSTAFQDAAGHVTAFIQGSKVRPGWGSITFAAGVMVGAKVASRYVPTSLPTSTVTDITTLAAVVGGALSIFGARLAGGCTSGHGISGCSTLSISSLITVASIFGGGIVFKVLFA